MVQDECGDIFYVRAEPLLRLHIQFAPNQKVRTARAIESFTPQIAATAKKNHFKQLIFESVFAPLVHFMNKRGFRSSKDEQVMDL